MRSYVVHCMETVKIRKNDEIYETETVRRRYDDAVDTFVEAGKAFGRTGYKVNTDPNQLTMEFHNLTESQERALLKLVKDVNQSGGQKISLVPGNGMYLLYFMRGNDGYAYVSNPMRPREIPEQAGTPQLGISDAFEIARNIDISAKRMLEFFSV